MESMENEDAERLVVSGVFLGNAMLSICRRVGVLGRRYMCSGLR